MWPRWSRDAYHALLPTDGTGGEVGYSAKHSSRWCISASSSRPSPVGTRPRSSYIGLERGCLHAQPQGVGGKALRWQNRYACRYSVHTGCRMCDVRSLVPVLSVIQSLSRGRRCPLIAPSADPHGWPHSHLPYGEGSRRDMRWETLDLARARQYEEGLSRGRAARGRVTKCGS
jgi:hypothetical protein